MNAWSSSATRRSLGTWAALPNRDDFLYELNTALVEPQLADTLGLCILGDRDITALITREVTSERANITVDADIDPGPGDAYTKAIWQFGTNPGSPIAYKEHNTTCKIKTINGERAYSGVHQITKN